MWPYGLGMRGLTALGVFGLAASVWLVHVR